MDYIIYIGCSAQASGLKVEMGFGRWFLTVYSIVMKRKSLVIS